MRLLIADDHTLFRSSLKRLLEAQGYEVEEAGTGREALERARASRPDLVLMDLQMPDIGGLEATRALLAEVPGTQVLILTGSDEEQDLMAALKAGAQGYLLKNLEPQKFFDLLERALGGEPALAPTLAQRMVQDYAKGGGAASPGRREPGELTGRESEVLELMVSGVTATRGMASRLGVSESTVKFHVRNILEKLQLDNRAQAVSYAVRNNLVRPPGGD
jgi:DNA-binding NarL/FixJ family response regulator